MSDTSPKNQRALQHNAPPLPARQPVPGELLFEFLVGHKRYRCELRDHGPIGVEAPFFENDEFIYSRRFDPHLDPGRPPRELAIVVRLLAPAIARRPPAPTRAKADPQTRTIAEPPGATV